MIKLRYSPAFFSLRKQKMKTKLVIIGLDRTGKTTVGRLLWFLSLGRIKFADTSRHAWEAEIISKPVKVLAKKLQKDRLIGGEVGQKARLGLVQLYAQWNLPIFRHIMSISDMYIGLRDMKVLERMRREYPLKVILVSANFKLARQEKADYGLAVLDKYIEQNKKYLEARPDYQIKNNGGWVSLCKQVLFLIKDLEASGELKPLDWDKILVTCLACIVSISYSLVALWFIRTYWL